MKAHLLFPQYFRPIGWILSLFGVILGYFYLYQSFEIPNFNLGITIEETSTFLSNKLNFTDELAFSSLCIGLMFIAFARIKTEDEMTAKIRLDSLRWSIFAHLVLVITISVLNNLYRQFQVDKDIWGAWSLFSDLNWIIYAYLTPLILFIIRFNVQLSKHKKGLLPIQKPLKMPSGLIRTTGVALSILASLIVSVLCINEWWGLGHPVIKIPEYLGVASWYVLPLALLAWIFAPDKNQDEYWEEKRLESWQISIYVFYAFMMITTFAVFGLNYLIVLLLAIPMLPLLYGLIYNIKKIKSNLL